MEEDVYPSGNYLDMIFNLFKVRYIFMTDLFKKFEFTNVNKVNFFINLESIYSYIHRENIESVLRSSTKLELNNNYKSFISNIINLAAHYRQYFTRARVTSNIIFYTSDFKMDRNRLNNHAYNTKYRKYFYNTYLANDKYDLVNTMIVDGVQLAKTICEHIDRVFLVNSGVVEASVVPYLLKDTNKLKTDLNIILTKDSYDLQYTNHNCIVLWPNKEESITLTKANVMSFLRYKNDMEESSIDVNINPKLIPFMLSVLGDKKRSIEKVKGIGFKKLYRGLEKLYLKDFISDENESSLLFESLIDLVKTTKGFGEDSSVKDMIGYNYYCIDLVRQADVVNQTAMMMLDDQIINKFDNDSLKKLNDGLFNDYPFNLQELAIYDRADSNPFESMTL